MFDWPVSHEITRRAPPTDGTVILIWGPHMTGWCVWTTGEDCPPEHRAGATHWAHVPLIPS